MGCTPSVTTQHNYHLEEMEPIKETVRIEIIVDHRDEDKVASLPLVQFDEPEEKQDTKIKKQKQKIQFLQQSQDFMKESVEMSNQVQQAILSLTYNPLLHDHSYYRLIGLNKKTIQKKQNRINNLLRRESQAELELKKQCQKKIQKTKSQIINCGKIKRVRDKQNRDDTNASYFVFSKQSFIDKMVRMQNILDIPKEQTQ